MVKVLVAVVRRVHLPPARQRVCSWPRCSWDPGLGRQGDGHGRLLQAVLPRPAAARHLAPGARQREAAAAEAQQRRHRHAAADGHREGQAHAAQRQNAVAAAIGLEDDRRKEHVDPLGDSGLGWRVKAAGLLVAAGLVASATLDFGAQPSHLGKQCLVRGGSSRRRCCRAAAAAAGCF